MKTRNKKRWKPTRKPTEWFTFYTLKSYGEWKKLRGIQIIETI